MTKNLCAALAFTIVLVGVASAQVAEPATTAGRAATARGSMVVSQSREASEAGFEALRRGGNAVDAAVATGFALAVTWPEAGNIGGGGFMLIVPPEGAAKPTVFDYRETAPAAATETMLAGDKIAPHLTVGVPGTVRGFAAAHAKFGKLPWRDLVLPAVKLARDGIVVDASLAGSLNFAIQTSPGEVFAETRRVFGHPDNRPWQVGDRLVQPELAKTLEIIAEQGADGFYRGAVAEDLSASVKAGGGVIEPSDLAAYKAIQREPLRGTFCGCEVLTPPNPSGGPALLQFLKILDAAKVSGRERWSVDTSHLVVESLRRMWRDRARWGGDPDFTQIPSELTSLDYAKKLAGEIDPQHATKSTAIAGDIRIADGGPETTHYGVVDANGWAVSNTYTLEQRFGSKLVVKGRGFLLNNEMGDFNPRPGVTTTKGQFGTAVNVIAPNKRMRSSMCPAIVLRDGKLFLVTGSPGGRTIISTVGQVVMNVVGFKMPLAEALESPRLNHQWLPDELTVEPSFMEQHAEVVQGLAALGHRVDPKPSRQGIAHSILVTPEGEKVGVTDKRRAGWAAGE